MLLAARRREPRQRRRGHVQRIAPRPFIASALRLIEHLIDRFADRRNHRRVPVQQIQLAIRLAAALVVGALLAGVGFPIEFVAPVHGGVEIFLVAGRAIRRHHAGVKCGANPAVVGFGFRLLVELIIAGAAHHFDNRVARRKLSLLRIVRPLGFH